MNNHPIGGCNICAYCQEDYKDILAENESLRKTLETCREALVKHCSIECYCQACIGNPMATYCTDLNRKQLRAALGIIEATLAKGREER